MENPRRAPAIVRIGLRRDAAGFSLASHSHVMDFRSRTLAELRRQRDALGAKRAVVGFDGFVDTIVSAVDQRRGPGEDFTPIATITEFGQRILGAAGQSTNLEFYSRREKLGGNGPILANALLAAGARVTYIGALGTPAVHLVFQELAARARTISLCAPAQTTAVEFTDGKLMLGLMRSLDEITYEKICATMGAPAFAAELGAADLVAFVNWTMTPHLTAVLTAIVERVLPELPARDRIFFFDLCDPEKRSVADLRAALATMARFAAHGRATLGLNLKEAQQVYRALGFTGSGNDEAALRRMAAEIRGQLGLALVAIHPKESAACATAAGTWWVPGPYTDRPLITTGAGDHFNAGFCSGLLLGLPPEVCLGLGVGTSGHYVRTGRSPSLADLESFLANWR
jgi:sugar/nucleoside kinase (ribokinase family)